MQISLEGTIVISFLGFCWLFAKKIYPFVMSGLDGHINEIKSQISNAEKLKNQAKESLQHAYDYKSEITALIDQKRVEADQRMQRLYDENERILRDLQQKQQAALDAQLKSEFVRQEKILMNKIADLVVDKLVAKIQSGECKISADFSKDDLQKLIGS